MGLRESLRFASRKTHRRQTHHDRVEIFLGCDNAQIFRITDFLLDLTVSCQNREFTS